MTSSKVPTLAARIERIPIAGSFTISRGAKTEAVTVVAELSQNGLPGRGECVPYPRYGETPEATLAAIEAMQDAIRKSHDQKTHQTTKKHNTTHNTQNNTKNEQEAKQA